MRLLTALLSIGILAGCGGDDDGGGGGGGATPVISKITWTKAAGCTPGVRSSYSVVTTATDSDTAEAMLTYSGTLSSCMPSPWTKAQESVSCPNLSSYSGSVTVRDPEGHSATKTFTVMPCVDGMAQ